MTLIDLMRRASDLHDDLAALVAQIGDAILEAVRPIIPDIYFKLGWYEEGDCTICWFSPSHTDADEETLKKVVSGERDDICFDSILQRVFSAPKWLFATPFGLYLSEYEADRVETELRELFKKEVADARIGRSI